MKEGNANVKREKQFDERSLHQWISSCKRRKAAKIAIRSPQFPYAVIAANGCDPRVMHHGAAYPALFQKGAQLRPVAFGFSE